MSAAIRAGFYLHHVAMQSSNPEALVGFYSDVMDMPVRRESGDLLVCEGRGRRFIATQGEDRKLAFAGLAGRDEASFDEFKAYLNAVGLPTEKSPSPYFEDGAVAVRDPDGNLICFGIARKGEATVAGLKGPTQHLTFASLDLERFQEFYHGKLGFAVSDRVKHQDGRLATVFTRSNHEHHTIACFLSKRQGVDHHSYEAGDWSVIRDWCDRFAGKDLKLMWGPGRHGPGNNLFIFIEDIDGNWIEISAELEVIHDRGVVVWPHEPNTLNMWGNAIMRS